LTGNIATAEEYESFYGFSVNLPSHWLVVTRSELQQNPDLFNLEKADVGNIDPNLLKQVIGKIQNGDFELYLNRKTSDPRFADNINIIKQLGRLPKEGTELNNQCAQLNGQLSKYFGRQINLYGCAIQTIDGKKALITEFDGAVEGTRSIQYQFQKSQSVLVVITATCKNDTADTIRREFGEMMKTIKFR